MDGDGSIQVNHWRYKSLQYRLVIKLKYCFENKLMLEMIAKNIGGRVRIDKHNTFVIWVVDDKKSIQTIIEIFKVYPPLTYRLKAQLKFMLACLDTQDFDWYFRSRKNKYLNFETNLELNYDYFKEWLSGFIEAEGCFCIRKSGHHSFSISQNNDKHLIEEIKCYFQINTTIRRPYPNKYLWSIETYNKSTLKNIILHCNNYPLIGQKLQSFLKFKDLII